MRKSVIRRMLPVLWICGILLTGCGPAAPEVSEGVSDMPQSTAPSVVTAVPGESDAAVTETTAQNTTSAGGTAATRGSTKPSSGTSGRPGTAATTAATRQTTAKPQTTAAPGEEPTDIGIWYSTWYGYTVPGSSSGRLDTWNAWGLDFKTLLPDGTFGYYDSKNTEVIRFHLEKMSEAQIDFIIMDQTNNIDVDGGYINDRSLAVAKYIKKYNDSGARPVRYCSAIGGIQWSQDAATIEQEAAKLWTRYNSRDFGGEKYHYYYEGKPLLVVYGDGAEAKWNAYTGDKTYASRFTIRWADNNSTPGYWGWAYNKGVQWHGETTVVMPGWHNRAGHTPVNRNYGETYKSFWRKILSAPERPRFIIINSFNEYAERTAVFPAVADADAREGDKWYKDESKTEDPYMYWNMTVDYIRQFKSMDKPIAAVW